MQKYRIILSHNTFMKIRMSKLQQLLSFIKILKLNSNFVVSIHSVTGVVRYSYKVNNIKYF